MNYQVVISRDGETLSIHYFDTIEEVNAFVDIFNASRHNMYLGVVAMHNNAF
jgi:hypothetical protein